MPFHRLRVTTHRGVALADPENLSDSEAGSGCCLFLRWAISVQALWAEVTYTKVRTFKPCDEPTLLSTLWDCSIAIVAAPRGSELSFCVIEVLAILAYC